MSDVGTAKEYIFACDERGTTRWPSQSKTWAIGGFIVESAKRQELVSAWGRIKLHLCGDADCELKWSHFFPGHHQEGESNPLLSRDAREWREHARWALSELFGATDILPVTVVVRKDRATDDAFVTADDGRKVLDTDIYWVGPLGQFALFLEEHNAAGEVWFDQLGSRQEEARKQATWERLRNGVWAVKTEYQAMLRRIATTLRFFDSGIEPVVQIADFVSGVIWAASEGDEHFLRSLIEEYFPRGPRTYSLVHVE